MLYNAGERESRKILSTLFYDNPQKSLALQHAWMLEDAMREQEHKAMVDEIATEVMNRLSLSFETGDALHQIKEINKAIKNLGK